VDLSCIILSGDLELYVLGMLPEDEAQKISQLILIFPEVKEEVDRISDTLNMTVSQPGPAPRAEVKEKIFREMAKMQAGNASASSMEVVREEQKETISMAPKRSSSLLMAASLIGLIVFAALVFWLFSRDQQNKRELARMEQDIQKLNNSLGEQKKQVVAYNQLLQIINDENYSGINLASLPGKPASKAKVYWNKNSGNVFVVNLSLPQPPADKQFQLWAIVGGKPVSAGMLASEKQIAQAMTSIKNAEAFAITLERKGGSPTPTMEEMYVLGKP
jgi:anti-sigma-K factor RskA